MFCIAQITACRQRVITAFERYHRSQSVNSETQSLCYLIIDNYVRINMYRYILIDVKLLTR